MLQKGSLFSASSILGCSSLAVVESLEFVRVVFLLVMLRVILLCLPIFSFNLYSLGCVSGDQSSRCQWIEGSDCCSLRCSRGLGTSHPGGNSLSAPGVCFDIMMLIWACFHESHLFGPAPAEFACSVLVPQKWLAQARSGGCHWLGLVLFGGYWLRPVPTDIPGLVLFLRMLLTWTFSCGGLWLKPALEAFSAYGLALWRLLTICRKSCLAYWNHWIYTRWHRIDFIIHSGSRYNQE